MVKMGIRMEGKGDFRDFECGMVVDARQAGLNIQYLNPLLSYWDFPTQPSLELIE